MCLLLVAHATHPQYRLLVAANRDEYHARPSAAAAYWDDCPGVLAGRDLEGGGTWLGVHPRGRFATVTNVRAGHPVRRGPRSRGLIVSDFLLDTAPAPAATEALAAHGRDYDGFNLLAWDGNALSWYSNRAEQTRTLEPGVYTLSNADLDTRWPKTERLRAGFARVTESGSGDLVAQMMDLLRDGQRARDDELPDTGIDRDMERALSSIFIEGATYGTRCSTVVTVDYEDRVSFCERRYDADAALTGESVYAFELCRDAP